jgi:prepilin-type N-terminal cleavage/methylation domain-containing protein
MTSIKSSMSDRSGFTLIELILTISIMAILFGIATLNFQTYQKKSSIEAQTRELFAVIMEARNNAFTQKMEHGVILQEKSYDLRAYSSDADTTGTSLRQASLRNSVTSKGAPVAGTQIRFDASGYLLGTFGTTLNINITDTSTSLNCMVIHAARVNMGKWNGTTSNCEFK